MTPRPALCPVGHSLCAGLFWYTAFLEPMARFAKRVLSIEPSPTVRISDLISDMKASGKDILSLAIGEPDFPTPAHIVDAAKKALDAGFTKYTPAAGIRELREAIAEKSRRENRIAAEPENVLVAPTKHTLFMTCMALLDTGDEAIIPDPGWVSYAPMVTLAGARPIPVRASDEEGFVPTADAVAEAITPLTRLLLVNSPSNPAGSVYSRAQTKALADLATDHDLVVVSDEIYEKILYEGEHVSPASLGDMFDRTVTVHGFSKTYSMTGWRLGWLVAPPALFKEISKVQEHTITCATAFAQKAGVAALRGPAAPLEAMVKEFRARRELVLSALAKIDGLSAFRPAGAFYVFPRLEAGMESAALAERILREANVAVTPGSAFGEAGERHLRLSYAASRKTIVEGIRRIGEVLARL
jgi:aspartate aminotransferase